RRRGHRRGRPHLPAVSRGAARRARTGGGLARSHAGAPALVPRLPRLIGRPRSGGRASGQKRTPTLAPRVRGAPSSPRKPDGVKGTRLPSIPIGPDTLPAPKRALV